MVKQIKITINYTMQRITAAVADQFAMLPGRIEVLDADNFRHAFYETEEEAVADIKDTVEDAMGLSGGVALGTVQVEVVDSTDQEKTFMLAADTLAKHIVSMVEEDYPDDVEMQRGEAGSYLGHSIEDIQTKIEKLLA